MSNGLIEHLRDLFEPLGPISARAMFGGHGLYFDGMIIGIIIEDALYLKVDEQTRPRFEAAGSAPYVYDMRGKPLPLSYWSFPEEAMDSPQAMRPWARLAIEAARRKPPPKPRGKRSR
ncbi:TfoX/Sxy family protein [Lysobacter niabensis]|uniref:TfoX/Sxy family protein n=1 Tax=Agrilutibacter niabensis TaxID=380628 RepID=UPI003611C6B4